MTKSSDRTSFWLLCHPACRVVGFCCAVLLAAFTVSAHASAVEGDRSVTPVEAVKVASSRVVDGVRLDIEQETCTEDKGGLHDSKRYAEALAEESGVASVNRPGSGLPSVHADPPPPPAKDPDARDLCCAFLGVCHTEFGFGCFEGFEVACPCDPD